MIAGLLLLIGGVIRLSLHAAGVPESLLNFLYELAGGASLVGMYLVRERARRP